MIRTHIKRGNSIRPRAVNVGSEASNGPAS
jgi:hypothetical protein